METIVIGVNHNNALGLIWSLHEAGHNVNLLIRESKQGYIGKSKYVDNIYFCDDDNKLIAKIKQTCCKLGEKPVVFVSGDTDATILNNHFQELIPYCYFEGGRSDGSINKYRDKNIGNELAKKCGFTLPKNVVIKKKEELYSVNLSYPLFIKANNSVHGGKVAMKKCDTYEEAKHVIDDLPNDFFPLQGQEFVDKEYEIMLLGCSLYGGKKVICPIANRKIRQYPKYVGLVSFGESLAVRHHAALMSLRARISLYLKEIEYTGLFSAEFLFSKGKYYFLEINLRNDGTSWLSTCSGYNLPDMVCRSFVDDNVSDDECSFVKKYYVNIYADLKCLRSGEITLYKWLKQFNKDLCYSHYNPRDKWPMYIYVKGILFKCLKNRMRNLLPHKNSQQ